MLVRWLRTHLWPAAGQPVGPSGGSVHSGPSSCRRRRRPELRVSACCSRQSRTGGWPTCRYRQRTSVTAPITVPGRLPRTRRTRPEAPARSPGASRAGVRTPISVLGQLLCIRRFYARPPGSGYLSSYFGLSTSGHGLETPNTPSAKLRTVKSPIRAPNSRVPDICRTHPGADSRPRICLDRAPTPDVSVAALNSGTPWAAAGRAEASREKCLVLNGCKSEYSWHL